jgi:hypothetical protein
MDKVQNKPNSSVQNDEKFPEFSKGITTVSYIGYRPLAAGEKEQN